MSDGGFELQKALAAAVKAAVSFTVYDFVPQKATLPYVVIGEAVAIDESDKSDFGTVHTVEVHVFSNYRGFKQVKETLSLVYDALNDASLSVTGQSVDFVRFSDSTFLVEPDGLTRHGIHRYDVRMSEA